VIALIIATFIIAIVALNKASKLEKTVAQLKHQLAESGVRAELPVSVPVEPVVVASMPPPVETMSVAVATPPAVSEPVRSDNWGGSGKAARPVSPPPLRPPRDMEQTLASRWFVWIGGAAIAIGGLLFVKYAYDNALISPTLQIVLGLLAGTALVGAGEFVRRKTAGETGYVPAALSAAGLVTGFGSIYAAYALYELISPTVAFGGLAAIALGALALSRLEGPLIAALGLIGSYSTPALIPSEHPSAWAFFPYLAVILVASFAVLRGKTWWWLGYAAIAGSGIWTALWLGGPFVPADTLTVGIFAHVIGFVAVFGLQGRRILDEASGILTYPKTITPPLAIGLAGLTIEYALTVGLVEVTNYDWLAVALFVLAMAGAVLIAWLKRGAEWLSVGAMLLAFAVLFSWQGIYLADVAMDESGNWSGILVSHASPFLGWMGGVGVALTLAGLAGTLRHKLKSPWSLTAAGSAFLFATGAWSRAPIEYGNSTWFTIAAVSAAVLLLFVYAKRQLAEDTEGNRALGILTVGSAALLVFALDRLLDNIWLTLAIAGLALAYALLATTLRVWLIGPIAAALGSLATIRLFVSRELWHEEHDLPLGAHWPLYGYGVPAILFYVASRLLKRAGHLRSVITLEGLCLGLLISLVSLELRVVIAGNITYEKPQFLEMAAHILTWLGAAYGLMYRQQLFSGFISKWGARVLIAGGVGAILLLSLGALNPLVTGEPVPGNAVFNALLLAYLAPVTLIGLIVTRLDAIGWGRLRPAAGGLALLLAFVYITMETKRVYQGHLMVPESLSVSESYAYSAVWLVFALALFVAGLKLAKAYVRYAGLGVMVPVVLKVFLLDMSSLEGLYRIASFVGLGICLVGIGWLYQRFVQNPQQAQTGG
jgi:uncharacterized membrane protein